MASKTKFGITFIPSFPPEKLVEYGRMAEEAGFDTVDLRRLLLLGRGFLGCHAAGAEPNR
jgi:hypothetical protein